jgi:hypothetical protein
MTNLYLSFIPSCLTQEHILYMCKKLGYFEPSNIVLKNHNNCNYCTAFIFVKEWFYTETSQQLLKKIQQGKTVYLQYSFPLYIKCKMLKAYRFK